jgi:prephenate dehydrogenase
LKVAVLGIGLIGGSIGFAARLRAGAQVCGYDPDGAASARALALGAIDTQATDLSAAVKDADVVFAAAPVGVLPETVRDALASAGPGCVVSDVGSTKRALSAATCDERFVGGHPLAGAETAGVEHARADLFEGAVWYLTPTPSTAGVLYERLHRLLASFGAQPRAIDADLHDHLMACFSHLPHVLANLLVEQGAARAAGALASGEQLPAAGPSFRDATRVAGANTAIWADIYLANRDALITEIDDAVLRLGAVRELLAAGDAEAIAAWNDDARNAREVLRGAGLAGAVGGESTHELRVAVPNRPGVLAEIALTLGREGVNIVDMALSPSADNSQGVIALWLRGAEHTQRAERLIGELGFPVVAP